MMMRHNQNKKRLLLRQRLCRIAAHQEPEKFVLYSVLTTVPMNTATSTRYTNSVLQAVILIPVLPKICSMYWNLHGPIRLLMTGKLMTMPSMPLIGMESYQYNGTYLSGSNSSLKEGIRRLGTCLHQQWYSFFYRQWFRCQRLSIDEKPYGPLFSALVGTERDLHAELLRYVPTVLPSLPVAIVTVISPSISAGWIMTNEKFMESTRSWLDYF